MTDVYIVIRARNHGHKTIHMNKNQSQRILLCLLSAPCSPTTPHVPLCHSDDQQNLPRRLLAARLLSPKSMIDPWLFQ